MKTLTRACLIGTLCLAATAATAQFGFISLDVTRTVLTQDPDLVLSVNVRNPGSTKSLGGWNNKKGVHLVVADIGRLECIPVPKSTGKPLQILEGGYALVNTGDPFKDWPKMQNVRGNIGVVIPLDDGENGDRFARMWVKLKHGQRVETHWLFGGHVKKQNIEADEVFSFHVLSVRDGNGNIQPWHLFPDGRTNYDSIVETLNRYGSGITPGSELAEGRDAYYRRDSDQRSPKNDRVITNRDDVSGPCLVMTSQVRRCVMIQWYRLDGSEGPQTTEIIEVGKRVIVHAPEGCGQYTMYDRFREEDDWVKILNKGQDERFAPLTRPRYAPFGGAR